MLGGLAYARPFYVGESIVMIINSKLSDQQLLNAIYSAAKEYSNLLNHEYLIIGKNKNSDYFWFQCRFEKKNFMHLLGIKSRSLTANEFYDLCDQYNHNTGTGITIKDCTPSRNHSRITINEKCSCYTELLRIKNAKNMKVGNKNKISELVDFTYAYGGTATLGFQKFKNDNSSYPITLIPKSIDNFSTQKYKIIFILEKSITEFKYKNIIMEIKQGLFYDLYVELPYDLKYLIDIKLSFSNTE